MAKLLDCEAVELTARLSDTVKCCYFMVATSTNKFVAYEFLGQNNAYEKCERAYEFWRDRSIVPDK